MTRADIFQFDAQVQQPFVASARPYRKRTPKLKKEDSSWQERSFFFAVLLTLWTIMWFIYRQFGAPQWIYNLPKSLREALIVSEFIMALALALMWLIYGWFELNKQTKRKEVKLAATRLENLLALTPSEFESFVAVVFRKKGYHVTEQGKTGDHGIDLDVFSPATGRRAVVQCKRYSKTVGEATVRDLYGVLIHTGADVAYLVTTGHISSAAKQWADGKPIRLIDGQMLVAVTNSLAAKS